MYKNCLPFDLSTKAGNEYLILNYCEKSLLYYQILKAKIVGLIYD